MIFNNGKPIYIQISERICDEIIAQTYKEDDRIPSVREYAVLLGVNNNTVMKAYEELSRNEIIYNKRGMGYFVQKGSVKQIIKERKEQFIKEQLPQLFNSMHQLNLGMEDIEKEWIKFNSGPLTQ